MRGSIVLLVVVLSIALVASALPALGQELFAWEQARMKAAADDLARLQASPHFQAQLRHSGWSASFLRRHWREVPFTRPCCPRLRPDTAAPGYLDHPCAEPRWEVLGRYYQVIPRRPYFLRSWRIERDRCLHNWLRDRLLLGPYWR